jgi:hypothetical protein
MKFRRPKLAKDLKSYLKLHFLIPGAVLIISLLFEAAVYLQPQTVNSLFADFTFELNPSVITQSIEEQIITPTPTEVPTPTPTVIPTATPKPTIPVIPKPSLPPVVSAPSSGYSKVTAHTGIGDFVADIISADLNSTKVIVDTASESDCSDNCPTLSLMDYVNRNGAYAGINGSFFCPADYPSCADKKNSFDTLVMNKNKTYFNSSNNVYSTVPAVIFSAGSARFVGQSLEWGRDTGVDSVIANYPMYLAGGNVVFGGSGDSKITSKGARTFVGAKGSTVYIGYVSNATGAEAAEALKALGLQEAIGLDQGGSTALVWGGRYIAGPGRGLPNAILFVRR